MRYVLVNTGRLPSSVEDGKKVRAFITTRPGRYAAVLSHREAKQVPIGKTVPAFLARLLFYRLECPR